MGVMKIKTIKRKIQLMVSAILLGSALIFTGGFNQVSQVEANGNFIVIKKGDTLYSIAKQYGTTVQKLKKENGLSDDMIYVGQRLNVPNYLNSESLFVVMSGSFTKKSNAEKLVSFLKQKKIDAVIVNRVIDHKTYYRIQAGAFSKRENAEKQIERIKEVGISDTYILTSKPLQVNGVTVGNSYNDLVDNFGVPNFSEEHQNIISHFYMNDGAGLRVQLNKENDQVNILQIYPDYLLDSKIPNETTQVIAQYDYPNKVEKVSCYETASCEKWTYQLGGNQLTVLIDHDGKTVQYLDLRKLP